MPFILGLLRPFALKIAAGLAIAGAIGLVLLRIYNAGKAAERVTNLQRAGRIVHDQQKAAANRPRTDDDLERVLGDGKF